MLAFHIAAVLFAVASTSASAHVAGAAVSDDSLPVGVVSRLGTPVRSSHHQAVAIAFSPDDAFLACAGLRTQSFRKPGSRFPIEVFHTKGMNRAIIVEGNESPVETLQFAPSKAQLASAGADGTLHLWDIDSGECLWTAGQLEAKEGKIL